MALEKFHYDHNGQTVVLPKFKHTPAGVVRKVRSKSEAEQIFTVLEALADDDALAIIDTMDTEQLQAFIAAWQKDSNVTVGESSASAS